MSDTGHRDRLRPPLRRHRPRRRGAPGGVRRSPPTLARRRYAPQPRRMADDHCPLAGRSTGSDASPPRRQTRGHARRPPEPDPSSLQDDRLRLIFTCCHPALVTDAQVALTLRLLGGLTAGEIAQGFLVPEATMAKRLPGPSRRSRPIGSHTASRPMPSCPTGSPVYSPRSTWSSTRATFPQAGAAPSGSICAPRRSGSHGSWHR